MCMLKRAYEMIRLNIFGLEMNSFSSAHISQLFKSAVAILRTILLSGRPPLSNLSFRPQIVHQIPLYYRTSKIMHQFPMSHLG